MHYYTAIAGKSELDAVTVYPPFNILASYHYFHKHMDFVKSCLSSGYLLFLDSGAFSAENSGKKIDIDQYCEFIKQSGMGIYAVLDVIGNHDATMANYEHMKSKGLNPIPAFHIGSSLDQLDELLKMDMNYIALGGLVFASGITEHCDEVWRRILKTKPHLRVHGFGVTNIELMARYPWHSVDSSSYKSCRRFGRQNILWNGFRWETMMEADYIDLLNKSGYNLLTKEQIGDDKELRIAQNKLRFFLYDMYSSNSYKQYAAHLTELNKYKGFPHLTAQTELF